jgi:hypothetical protein
VLTKSITERQILIFSILGKILESHFSKTAANLWDYLLLATQSKKDYTDRQVEVPQILFLNYLPKNLFNKPLTRARKIN